MEEEEEEERERKRQSIVHEEEGPRSPSESHPDAPNSPSAPGHQALDLQKITTPPDTTFSPLHEPPSFNGAERPTSPEGRLSSQTTRPDLYSYATYTYGKPKVKLGPRPSIETNKRPHTASNFRPIAALPAGFKGFSKGSKKGKLDDKSEVESEQREQEATAYTNLTVSTNLLAVPKEVEQQQTISPRPATSSGASIKSIAASISSVKENHKMTPEKARLMKAMKMREKKKKMNASNLAESNSLSAATHNGITTTTTIEEANTEVDEQSKTDPSAEGETHSSSIAPSDSGISIDPPTPKSVNTETRSYGTTSDSHPPSPTAASMSEIGDSTKASSLSESTDETIQANKEEEEAAGNSTQKDNNNSNGNSNDDADTNYENQIPHNEAEQHSKMTIEDSTDSSGGIKMRPVETDEPAPEVPKVTPEDPQADTLKKVASEDATSTAFSQSLSQESQQQQISEPHPSSFQTTEPTENIRDTVAVAEDITSKHPTKLRTTDLDTPPDQDDSPKSVLGVPRSKFSASEPKSSTSSSSSRSPTLPAPKLRSKFSTQDLRNRSGTVSSQSPLTISADTIVAKESQPSKEKDKGDIEEQSLQGNQESLVIPPKSSRRKSVDPLRTDLTASKTPQSEVSDPLLDDDLMDELQSAEVQEARPMLVSKSPINPVFPGNNLSISKDADTKGPAHLVRTVSNPIRGPLLVPTDVSQSSARSVSAGGAAYLHNITRQPSSAGLLKKGGVGSSISQRIKALEKLSSTTVKDDGRPKTATPTSSFYTVQKGTIQQPSKPASLADRASSVTRGSPPRDESREHTPDTPEKQKRGRSGSMANRLTVFEGQGLIPPAPRGRPESIQVTARILRDNTQDSLSRPQSRRDPTEFGPVELKESPLIIDVRKSEPEPKSEAPAVDSPKETIMERRMSRDLNATPEDVDKKSRRPSLGIVKDFIKDRRASVISKSTDNLLNLGSPKTATRPPSSNSNYSNLVRRMSTSSRRSLSYDRDSNGNSMPLGSPSVISDNSGDDEKGNDKKSAKNRASRFMRRLSNSFAPSRKAVSANISPTLTEEPADEAAALPETQPSVSAYMGDVNVQFPDNLLWKRRSMCLDTSGWLILSAVQGAGVGGKDKAGIKRYHLSDFRAPYAPDVEVQELPNSVRLDLVEGSCLQIACEDRNGQVNALQCKFKTPFIFHSLHHSNWRGTALQDAHRNHSSLGH